MIPDTTLSMVAHSSPPHCSCSTRQQCNGGCSRGRTAYPVLSSQVFWEFWPVLHGRMARASGHDHCKKPLRSITALGPSEWQYLGSHCWPIELFSAQGVWVCDFVIQQAEYITDQQCAKRNCQYRPGMWVLLSPTMSTHVSELVQNNCLRRYRMHWHRQCTGAWYCRTDGIGTTCAPLWLPLLYHQYHRVKVDFPFSQRLRSCKWPSLLAWLPLALVDVLWLAVGQRMGKRCTVLNTSSSSTGGPLVPVLLATPRTLWSMLRHLATSPAMPLSTVT